MSNLKQQRREKRRDRGEQPQTAAPAAGDGVPRTDDLARRLLEWLLHDPKAAPAAAVAAFFRDAFEQRAVHITGRAADHFAVPTDPALLALLPNGVAWSTDRMRRVVVRGNASYGTDVNVVRFDPELRKRVPLKTEGVIRTDDYDAALKSGWSARYLRPQEHSPQLAKLLYVFDEAMSCSTGMNSYWTPGGSQGFAPHYDDVEVFMLQLEGAKRWRVYRPPTEADDLARHSSPDFLPEDMPEPFLDVMLRAGDVLYLPRGWVHQGTTPPGTHSLHVTLSANQMHTYADLLDTMLRSKVDTMASRSRDVRRALPIGWWDALGARFNPKVMGEYAAPLNATATAMRAAMQADVRRMCRALLDDIAHKDGVIDKAADLFAKQVLERRQPPVQPPSSAVDAGAARWVRVADPHAVRLVLDGDEAQLHHCAGNSVVCLGPTSAAPVTVFDVELAPAISQVIAAYPRPVVVSKLVMPGIEDDADAQLERANLVDALVQTRAFEVGV